MIQPRTYQTEAVSSIYNYFARNKGNPIVAMPTGTGKSVVIASFLYSIFTKYPRQKILVLTHVKELIQQNYDKLKSLWNFAPIGIYSSGLGRQDNHAPIVFAGIASVARKASLFGHVDLILIDEAHLVSPSETTMYQHFLAELRKTNPHLKVIGLTATPWRLGHGRLTDPIEKPDGSEIPSIFTDVCFDITGIKAFNRLIAEGYISPLIPKATSTKLDVDGVHLRGGEFVAKELQFAVDKYEITLAAAKESIELGHNRNHWLVFASGIDHAIHTAEILNDLGVSTTVVHSKMTNADRDKAIEGFKAGKYRAAVNNNVLTTGFDFPAIDMIICLRPTSSSVLWVQMLGRGTRPATNKENCLVLDFANNTKRLGPINDPVIPRKKGHKSGDAPVKECPVCSCFVHASLRLCNGILFNGEKCTHEFKFQTKLQQAAGTEELIKGDMPIVEVYKIDHIVYSEHKKEGRPPSLKITYYCGLNAFTEYSCFEHENAARYIAHKWWQLRSDERIPNTTAEALAQSDTLKTPTHLRVWINKRYPEILAVCFDGTAFGKEENTDDRPTIYSENSSVVHNIAESGPEDEIPF